MTIDNITKDKINSIKLQVATDAGCNNVTELISAKIEDGDLIFKPTKSTANNYYKFVFDCQKGSSNGLIQISKIAYYKVAAKIEDGDLIFKPTKSTANNYYKFVFDCQKGSSNGLIQISKIAYYKVGDTPEIVDITNTAETAYTIAKAKELIDAGKGLSENVYVKGTVSQASESLNDTYGSLSYYISDDGTTGNELQVYGRVLYLRLVKS